MKKLELKGMQMLTKEQMKRIAGGELEYCECLAADDTVLYSGYIDCVSDSDPQCWRDCLSFCGLNSN